MTNIVNKNLFLDVKFGDIEIGEFFKYCNGVYLKTSHSNSVDSNAFNLTDNDKSIFDVDDTVQAVNATVIIEPQYIIEPQ